MYRCFGTSLEQPIGLEIKMAISEESKCFVKHVIRAFDLGLFNNEDFSSKDWPCLYDKYNRDDIIESLVSKIGDEVKLICFHCYDGLNWFQLIINKNLLSLNNGI